MSAAAPAATDPVQLTEEQSRQYKQDGYCLIRGLIPREEMAPVREALIDIEEGNHDWPDEYFQWLDPSAVRNEKGTRIPAGVQGPAQRSETFRNIADHPRLISAMSQILGGPVARFTDQCGIKSRHITTEQGGQTFYHQDSYYWRINPQLGCNCWIPTDDVGKDSIALAIMPGSQAGWKLDEHEDYYDDPKPFGGRSSTPFKRHRIPLDRVDYSKEILIPMHPGDGLFFTNYTWHRSEKNKTGRTLCFYAIAYKRT